jgi:hypothetical protein
MLTARITLAHFFGAVGDELAEIGRRAGKQRATELDQPPRLGASDPSRWTRSTPIAQVLFVHGTSDDWVPIGPCREYVARLSKADMTARLIEYPDAPHVFDAPALRDPVKLPQALTGRNCRFAEVEGGSLVNAATKQPCSLNDPYFEKGVTIQYNEADEDVNVSSRILSLRSNQGDCLGRRTTAMGVLFAQLSVPNAAFWHSATWCAATRLQSQTGKSRHQSS